MCLQQPQPRKSEAALADTRLKVKHGHCATIPLSLSLGSSLKTASLARACGALAGSRSRPPPPLQRPCAVVWAVGRPLRPADLAVSAERPMLFFEAVGGRSLYHCTALARTSCILADCMSLPLSQSKKKVRTLSSKNV